MARKSKLRPEEIAEIDATKRTENRKRGFSMMSVRDKGWGRLIDLKNKQEVIMVWHLPGEENNHLFKLILKDRKEIVLDYEQFQRLARWI